MSSSSNEQTLVEDETEGTNAYEEFHEMATRLLDPPDVLPQSVEVADPSTYDPFDFTQLPQTEDEVKIAVEDLTLKLRNGGITRRNLLHRSLKEHLSEDQVG
jgi:hypothetical protein